MTDKEYITRYEKLQSELDNKCQTIKLLMQDMESMGETNIAITKRLQKVKYNLQEISKCGSYNAAVVIGAHALNNLEQPQREEKE